MSGRKIILLAILVVLALFNQTAWGQGQNHKWDLLRGVDSEPNMYKELEIGEKIVYWRQRKLGDAIVERDQIVYHFDKNTRELIDLKISWREDLPDALPKLNVTKEQAEKMVKGTIQFTKLYIISPESDVFPIKPTPKNPCWVVRSIDDKEGMVITIVDAVEGKILGNGIVPPYTGMSLTGADYGNCTKPAWVAYRDNAANWFETMGYPTERLDCPSENQVKNHIQSFETAMFYEAAHGDWIHFRQGCGWILASDIEDWIEDYPKMPFTFLGSCDAMCGTSSVTLSYAFRKGSMTNTVTVGYCGMGEEECSNCLSYSRSWETALFSYMNEGYTVKAAFNKANSEYPACADNSCMRFKGDTNFKVVPLIGRMPVKNITTGKFYTSIQAAINDPLTLSGQGHVIVVYAGTYRENLDFKGKAITVRSTNPNDPVVVSGTIIKSVDNSIAVSFISGETSDSVLTGFTVSSSDIGIYCSTTAASEDGPTISQCTIKQNTTGLYCLNNSPSILGCTFINNSYEAITCESSKKPVIRSNAILNSPSGIGLWTPLGVAEIQNNTIANNDRGLWIAKGASTVFPEITNCIFWNNIEDDLSVWDEYGQYELPDIIPASYCCIESLENPGEPNYPGCINDDPLFKDLSANNIHLQVGSPCIDAGDLNGNYDGQVDIDGEARAMDISGCAGSVDIGADEARCYVHNVSTDTWYDGIQEAIDAVPMYGSGLIKVWPGTYHEKLVIEFKDITLSSIDPNDWDVVKSTVIEGNGNGTGRTVFFRYFADTCIKGFTITGGSSGIYCYDGVSAGTIQNCIIEGNSNVGLVFDELAGGQGPVYVDNCIFRNNTNAGLSGGTPATRTQIKNSLIANNGTAILANKDTSYTVDNCTIVNNDYGVRKTDSRASVSIKNCILWNHLDQLDSCHATYSCIKDPNDASGEGNIFGDANDPLFADTEYYHLQAGSPCINTGKLGGYEGQVDIDGEPRVQRERVDIGADEATVRVHNVTADLWYVHIQDAIDEAVNGDKIMVYPGVYYESVDFVDGKVITVQGTDPNDWDVVNATVVDGSGAENTFVLGYGSLECRLKGLTVIGGTQGVYCTTGGHTFVENCVIRNNSMGIKVYNAVAKVSNCIIKNNSNEGISIGGASMEVKNCVISDNDTGMEVNAYCGPTVHNCTIVGNTSYGIKRTSPYSSVSISNCILWNNGDELYNCSATYSCIENCEDASGTGNICGNANAPLFVDTEYYRLQIVSPCINTGDPAGDYEGQVDIDGDTRVVAGYVDMGADEALSIYNLNKRKFYATVNEAAEDANESDTVVIYPGTYYESLDMSDYPSPPYNHPKDITIRGSDPYDWDVVNATVIDGNGATNTIVMSYGTNSLLAGLTVTGGTRGVHGSTSTVSNCIIRDNSNEGVRFGSGEGTLSNCIVKDNGDSGIALDYGVHTTKNSLIHGNYTGIMAEQCCNLTISNCTIVNNDSYGVKKNSQYASANISNCIVWDNGDDLYDYSATYSCIKDPNDAGGTGNICTDPCFFPDDEYYHLQPGSPCIDVGDPAGDYNDQVDIDGDERVLNGVVDIGADEVSGHLWMLDEESGTTAYDSIDDDDGIFNGSDPCWVDGILGGAVECNGVSDYFSVPSLDNGYSASDTFTVAGWFKTDQSTGIQTIVGQWSQEETAYYDSYGGWQVIVKDSKVVVRTGVASCIEEITGASYVDDGEWHHFALVHPSYPPSSVSLYVDGELDSTPQNRFFYTSDPKFRIGDGSYVSSGVPVIEGGPFNGTIDDIMIFERELSAEEVEQLYSRGGL